MIQDLLTFSIPEGFESIEAYWVNGLYALILVLFDAWAQYHNKSANDAGLIYGTNYTITNAAGSVTFTVTGGK